jgi:hypothetical protein
VSLQKSLRKNHKHIFREVPWLNKTSRSKQSNGLWFTFGTLHLLFYVSRHRASSSHQWKWRNNIFMNQSLLYWTYWCTHLYQHGHGSLLMRRRRFCISNHQECKKKDNHLTVPRSLQSLIPLLFSTEIDIESIPGWSIYCNNQVLIRSLNTLNSNEVLYEWKTLIFFIQLGTSDPFGHYFLHSKTLNLGCW